MRSGWMTGASSPPHSREAHSDFDPDPGAVEGSERSAAGAGVLLYTDGLTERDATASCSDSRA